MKRAIITLLTFFAATPAFAHVNLADHGSLTTGLSHPFLGPDHILAMTAVGLWAAVLGGRGVWALPCAFVGSMLVGFSIAVVGQFIPASDSIMLMSVLVPALGVALALRLPVGVASGIVATFGLFHGAGHAGGIGVSDPLVFGTGLVLATAVLHCSGIALAIGVRRVVAGSAGQQGLGWLTALGGLWVAFGL